VRNVKNSRKTTPKKIGTALSERLAGGENRM